MRISRKLGQPDGRVNTRMRSKESPFATKGGSKIAPSGIKIDPVTDTTDPVEFPGSMSRYLTAHFSDSENRFPILHAVVGTILGETSDKQFLAKVHPLLSTKTERLVANGFRAVIRSSGYCALSLRPFLFAFLEPASPMSEASVRLLARRYGVTDADWENCYAAQEWLRAEYHTNVRARLRVRQNRIVFYPYRIQQGLASIWEEMHKHVDKFVGYRMRFITKYHNIEKADLVGDIMFKVQVTYYWECASSTKSRLHILNYLRRTATNYGLSRIAWYTTSKRARIFEDVDTGDFRMIEVSESQFDATLPDASPMVFADLIDSHMHHPPIEQEMVEERVFVQQLVAIFSERKPELARLVQLVMGQADLKFTGWLWQKKGMDPTINNEDLLHLVSAKRYVRLVSEFLGTSIDRVRTRLNRIAHYIGLVPGPAYTTA